MKVLHLVFHPDLGRSKVNAVWIDAAKAAGFSVKNMYQLYGGFEFDIAKEQEDLLAHDRIVFQFPLYWYSCPALMKKWQDDVLSFGFAYGPQEKMQLVGKDMMLCFSVGGPQEAYRQGGYNRFALPELLRPLEQTAYLCQMNYCEPFWIHSARVVSDDVIREQGQKMVEHIKNAGSVGS